jgi:PAS domain S-box-containing protein
VPRVTAGGSRFDVAMRHARAGIALVDRVGGFLEVNDALCDILARDRELLLTSTWQELTHPDDLAVDAALVSEVLAGARDDYRLSMRYLRPDGSVVHGDLSVACVRDGVGAVDYFIWQILDVSESVRLRDEYRLLAENVSDVVVLGTGDGMLQWVLPSVTEVMGWEPDELTGTRFIDLVHPDEAEHVASMQERVGSGERVQFEARLRTREGGFRWMSIRVRPILDAHGTVVGRVAGWWDDEERHRTSEALEAARERYRAAMEAESDPHVFLDAVHDDHGTIVDFRYVDANELAASYLGLPRERLVGSTLGAIRPRQVGSPMFRRYVETVETGVALIADDLEIDSEISGPQSYFDVRGVRVGDGLSLTWRLVTDRVRARTELAESERALRLLAENASDVVFRASPQAVLEWVSPSVREVLGGEPDDYVGRPVADLVDPDDLAAMRHASAQVNSGERAGYRARMRTADGWRWFEVSARPVREEGLVVARVGSLRDVHEQVVAEQALAAAEEAYRLLAEHANDVVVRMGPDRVVDTVVGATDALLGRTPDEVVGRPVVDLFVPEDTLDENERLARLAGGERALSRVRVRRPDGSIQWVDRRSSAVLGPDGSVEWYVSALTDAAADEGARAALAASERQARELAERYEAARNEALDANSAKTLFLSRMSHELRTPLNAILGFAQLLELDDLTADQREAVQQIRGGGRHLLDIVSEVLDISRIEAGRISLSMESVSIIDAVHEAVDLVRRQAADSGVVIEQADECQALVWADRQRVIQIVLNLLTNAVKYNRPGGRVTISCEDLPERMVALQVADTGVGLDAGQIARLFEPFDRLGAERTSVEGTGIGLTLSEGLARAMSGRLEVSSVAGEGSVFSLVLPASSGAATRGIPITTHAALDGSRDVAILYVEDNPANQALMSRIVRLRPGSRLRLESDGLSGVAAAEAERYDLVLLDLHLPDIRGDEVLVRLRGLAGYNTTPIVIVTADASRDVVRRLTGLGADAVITKPVDIDEVLAWMDQPHGGGR